MIKRQFATILEPMQRNDGEIFAAGTFFEILRDDGDTVNLCETDILTRLAIGRTICSVDKSKTQIENE